MNERDIVPKYVFIVPYRNRSCQKFFFTKYLTSILPTDDKYEVYISHQSDSRPFNRGAMKNIGFKAVKKKYPHHYKDIVLVFNDVDLVPFTYIFEYAAGVHSGIVKHYYGFTYALGGIVAITGGDFEASNGFPNFWGWGMEDHIFQNRCINIGLHIDRSTFFPLGSPEILHLFDGVSRIVAPAEANKATQNTHTPIRDGVQTIRNLRYSIDTRSTNTLDNIHVVDSPKIFMINVVAFDTQVNPKMETFYAYDLRDPISNIIRPVTAPVGMSASLDQRHVPEIRSSQKSRSNAGVHHSIPHVLEQKGTSVNHNKTNPRHVFKMLK